MRKVDRGSDPPPPALRAKNKEGLTELERARAHQQDPDPKKGGFTYAAYKADEVKRRLEELFHGKCAYCETFYASGAPVDIEHFRPKGAVDGEPDHPGYWWIAMRWENLLPSCIDCNRKRNQVTPIKSASLLALSEGARTPDGTRTILTGKKDSFPIAGVRAQPEDADFATEHALLIDPCVDEPDQHLDYNVSGERPVPLVLPKVTVAGPPQEALPDAVTSPEAVAAHASAQRLSVRGAVSIQVYGLNRLRLVQDRTRIMRQLEFLGSLVTELGLLIDELSGHVPGIPALSLATGPDRAGEIIGRLQMLMDRALVEIRTMTSAEAPYSAMAKAWMARFLAELP